MNKKINASIQLIEKWFLNNKNEIISTTSGGATSALLIDLIDKSECDIPIVFLDTGFLFEETITYYNELVERYSNLKFIKLYESNNKKKYFDTNKKLIKDTKLCCLENKINLLDNYLKRNSIKCWFTALRKDQNDIRKNMKNVQINSEGIYKVLPVLDWTSKEVFEYMIKNKLPFHPLFNRGYESIGCYPCTEKGEGRDGRWANSTKTECGLHI